MAEDKPIGAITGVGVERDIYEALKKHLDDGKIESFVFSIKHTKQYQQDLALELHVVADGTSGMAGHPASIGAQLVQLLSELIAATGRNSSNFLAGILHALVLSVRARGVKADIISV